MAVGGFGMCLAALGTCLVTVLKFFGWKYWFNGLSGCLVCRGLANSLLMEEGWLIDECLGLRSADDRTKQARWKKRIGNLYQDL